MLRYNTGYLIKIVPSTETGKYLVLWGCDLACENTLLSVYHFVSSAIFRGETLCSTKTHMSLGCLSDGLLVMHP